MPDALGASGTSAAVPDPRRAGRFHYAGIAGSGMSALAQFQVMLGGKVSGSDRAFDRGERGEARERLENLQIAIYPQDGSGLEGEVGALVVSTAVEDQVPDFAAAQRLGIPIIHRSELLAHFVAARRSIAVSGTSGKSTVVAMVFEILRAARCDPSVITGGELLALQKEGLWGNAWHGETELLVVEADESDGSLVRYSPAVGVVLNLQRDHREMEEVARMFETFRANTRERFVIGDAGNLARFVDGATVFGFSAHADLRGEGLRLWPGASLFEVEKKRFRLPVPGRHNVENALAAIAICRTVGVRLTDMVDPLERFQGVARRFQQIGATRGVEVVDDFAHNPDKIRAAVETARHRGRRILAVYQPHGYGPTRFLRDDLVRTFAEVLGPGDRLWILEIFYAGGTATRDFSSADLVAEIAARGTTAEFAATRDRLIERVRSEAKEGDVVLIMGARDPSLTELARGVLRAL